MISLWLVIVKLTKKPLWITIRMLLVYWNEPNKSIVKLRLAKVKLIGHVIFTDGLKRDPDKVIAIRNMPKPKSEVLTCLGFVNYFSKFLPKLSVVT